MKLRNNYIKVEKYINKKYYNMKYFVVGISLFCMSILYSFKI